MRASPAGTGSGSREPVHPLVPGRTAPSVLSQLLKLAGLNPGELSVLSCGHAVPPRRLGAVPYQHAQPQPNFQTVLFIVDQLKSVLWAPLASHDAPRAVCFLCQVKVRETTAETWCGSSAELPSAFWDGGAWVSVQHTQLCYH